MSVDVESPSTTAPKCMRADQLARFLGVNRKTVYEYATRGLIRRLDEMCLGGPSVM